MKNAIFFFLFTIGSVQAQIETGLWEPYYKGKTKKSVFFTGKSIEKFTGNSDEHGTAVGFILTQNAEKSMEIYHAGFTPTTKYLRETGILAMTVEERRKNLDSEYKYWELFVRETVNWFKKQKVKVVNMSFGNSALIFAENNQNLGYNDTERLKVAQEWMHHFQQAFDNAFKSAPEILFIVAAGNDEMDMQSSFDVPGLSQEPNVLCVGALSKDGKRKISNYGDAVDVYIPAEDIEWVDAEGKKQYDSGTSLAVPQITKKAIMLLTKNPKMSIATLKRKLISKE